MIKSNLANTKIESMLQKFICISLLEFYDFKTISNKMKSLSNNEQNIQNHSERSTSLKRVEF